MQSLELSLVPNEGGRSETVAVSTTSAQSSVLYATGSPGYVNLMASVDVFMRTGTSPVALSNGTDQLILAGNMVRVGPIPAGNRLAFITASGSGTVYITKES